jgi:hypothetical protein
MNGNIIVPDEDMSSILSLTESTQENNQSIKKINEDNNFTGKKYNFCYVRSFRIPAAVLNSMIQKWQSCSNFKVIVDQCDL